MTEDYKSKLALLQKIDPFVYHEQAKPDTRHIKGMIFAGCSFTWGQGLYYYSNLPSIQEARENTWKPSIVTFSQIEYMKSIRFPRLVANHFNTFELCHPNNGGSNETIMDFWNNAFIERPDAPKYFASNEPPQYYYKDFQFIIFQLTQWTRSKSIIDANFTNASFINSNNFEGLLDNSKLTEFINHAILNDLTNIKKFLQKFESNGVKALVLSWPEDFVPYINEDTWYKDRFIPLSYNNNNYTSIEELMKSYKNLCIRNDSSLQLNPKPLDDHPSALCHKIIANNIIKKIEEVYE